MLSPGLTWMKCAELAAMGVDTLLPFHSVAGHPGPSQISVAQDILAALRAYHHKRMFLWDFGLNQFLAEPLIGRAKLFAEGLNTLSAGVEDRLAVEITEIGCSNKLHANIRLCLVPYLISQIGQRTSIFKTVWLDIPAMVFNLDMLVLNLHPQRSIPLLRIWPSLHL